MSLDPAEQTSIDFNKLLSNAKTGGFALPEGEYTVRIIQATSMTAGSGAPMVKVRMEIESGEFVGSKVFNNFVLTMKNPRALNIFFRHMAAFGLDQSYFQQLGEVPNLDAVASGLMNRRAKVKLTVGEYLGQPKNEVVAITPADAPGVPQMPGPSTPQRTAGPRTPMPVPPQPPRPESVGTQRIPPPPPPPVPQPPPTPESAPAPKSAPTPESVNPTPSPQWPNPNTQLDPWGRNDEPEMPF